jgi:hypothetical protein
MNNQSIASVAIKIIIAFIFVMIVSTCYVFSQHPNL